MAEERKVLHDRLDEQELKKIRAASVLENEQRAIEARQVIRDTLGRKEVKVEGDIHDFTELAKAEDCTVAEINQKIARANAILTECNKVNIAKTRSQAWAQAANSGIVGVEEQWAETYQGNDVAMPLIKALESKHGLSSKDGLKELASFTEHREWSSATGNVNDIIAATMTRGGGTGNTPTGITPDRPRSTEVPYQVVDKRRSLVEILPKFPVANDTFKFLAEPLTAASATPVPAYQKAENTAAAVQDVGLVEKSVAVEKLLAMVTISREQLRDVSYARAYASMILSRQSMDNTENQCFNGDGTAPNLQGLYGLDGKLTQSRVNAETRTLFNFYADAFGAYGEPRGTGAGTSPSHLFTSNAEYFRLLKAVGSDGHYLWGDPVTGAMNTIWGVEIVVGDFHPAQSAVLLNADPRYILMITREGIEIETGLNGTDFSADRISMRISHRCALAVPRPETVMTLGNLDGVA